jgi:DNA-directed RNA polymerase subunit RPC12/RpoP
LKRHLRVHTGDKTFSAQIVCPRSWIAETSSSTRRRKTLPLLLVYNVIWTGQWINGSYKSSHWIETYSCSQCTKSSAWSTKLQQHIRIHSGEKPYICMKCQKAFSRSEKFKLQMKRHDLKLNCTVYKSWGCCSAFILYPRNWKIVSSIIGEISSHCFCFVRFYQGCLPSIVWNLKIFNQRFYPSSFSFIYIYLGIFGILFSLLWIKLRELKSGIFIYLCIKLY